jgi:putative PIN family toxin of toxin-antitoxin system
VRVFPDTNVLAAALATRGLCAELFEVMLQSHDLLTSREVLAELSRILRGKPGMSEGFSQEFISLISDHAETVEAERPWPSLPDPDDEAIIAAAIAGKADVFVSGDKALLELQMIGELPILSPRQFWELLARNS